MSISTYKSSFRGGHQQSLTSMCLRWHLPILGRYFYLSCFSFRWAPSYSLILLISSFVKASIFSLLTVSGFPNSFKSILIPACCFLSLIACHQKTNTGNTIKVSHQYGIELDFNVIINVVVASRVNIITKINACVNLRFWPSISRCKIASRAGRFFVGKSCGGRLFGAFVIRFSYL